MSTQFSGWTKIALGLTGWTQQRDIRIWLQLPYYLINDKLKYSKYNPRREMSQECPGRNITLHRDVLQKITAGIKTSSDIKGGLYQKQ